VFRQRGVDRRGRRTQAVRIRHCNQLAHDCSHSCVLFHNHILVRGVSLRNAGKFGRINAVSRVPEVTCVTASARMGSWPIYPPI
jgi:hypothetical protein